MNLSRYLQFTRLLDANERDLITKKQEGAFSSQVAERTLMDLMRILEAEGYKINKRRLPPKALSGAFAIVLEQITASAWLSAIVEDESVDYTLELRIPKRPTDSLRKLIGIKVESTDSFKCLSALLEVIQKKLLNDASISDIYLSDEL